MASLATKLTLAEFEQQYGREKPYYEYWNGQAVEKSMPTWMHGLLQIIIGKLLVEAGYRTGAEVKLKIDPDFQFLPDVIATRGPLEFPYPTKSVEVIVEILSDDDPMSRVLAKCRKYEAWGFAEIYVVDPAARAVLQWHDGTMEQVSTFASVSTEQIWSAVDQALS